MTLQNIEMLPYRRNVGVMMVNADDLVWVGRRRDINRNAWQMPQGGIDCREEPHAAALRELEEETGVGRKLVEYIAETPGWLSYDLPVELVPRFWQGRYRGQEQKWFLMRFLGKDSQVNIKTCHPEFCDWRWLAAPELPELVVAFKRDVYARVVAEFSAYLK